MPTRVAKASCATATLGAAFMALFLVMGSLWPGIALHAAVDFLGGWVGLLIPRERGDQGSR